MKILFAGTPHFSATVLERLADAGYDIVGVVTQPDRMAGRGRVFTASPVKQLALNRSWPIFQPNKLKDDDTQHLLLSLGAEVFIVAAYGRLLPTALLKGFKLGAINVHASLLPRWRGAAPIERAIAEGDQQTGISIMLMTEGLDEGPVYRSDALEIGNNETAEELANRLALLGGESLLHVLNRLPDLLPTPQPSQGATYAHKITTADGAIDFNQSAEIIYQQIRAFTTNPGCFFTLGEERIRVGAAQLPHFRHPPSANAGDIMQMTPEGVVVQCADRPIRLVALQRAGRKMMAAAHVIEGLRLTMGQTLLPLYTP